MTDPEIVIRPAERRDLSSIGRMGADLVRLHYALDAQRFMKPAEGLAEGYGRFLGSQSRRDAALVLVADQAGGIVGYVYAAIEPLSWQELREEAGFIHDLFVDASARGHGIAVRLVEAVTTWARARGAPRIILHTAEQNQAAQRLFARLGFRRTMVEMTKEIASE